MKLYSLRRATLRAIIVPLAVAIILTTLSSIWLTNRAIGTLLDDQMQQEAAFLLLLSKHEAAEGEEIGLVRTVESREMRDLLGTRASFRIWSSDILMTESSANAKPRQGPPQPGFSTLKSVDGSWRTFAIRYSDLPITIEISESAAMRGAMCWQIIRSLVLPLLFLFMAVCLIAYWQITAALRPMARISAEIDTRDVNDLRPLHGHRLPREVEPLFEAFNRLITRLGAAVAREREFTDNAAHELRTPLAALKTRAQVVTRALEGQPEQQQALGQLVAATDRATGIINHLLLLGRLQSSEAALEPVDLSALAADVARDLVPLALQKGQQFGANIAPGIMVSGQVDPLAMMIRNVLDNAIRYSPNGSTIGLSLARLADGQACLQVVDNGPGIATADLSRVVDRFVRLSTTQQGSGLGLSIVQRVAEWHGGSLSLRANTPHGLALDICLPTADAPSNQQARAA